MGAASKPPPLYNKVHGGEVFYGAPGAVCVCVKRLALLRCWGSQPMADNYVLATNKRTA